MSMKPWYEVLNLKSLSEEDRARILQYVVDKHGRDRVQEILKVSRITMWRLLNGKSRLDDERLKMLLATITEDEFRRVLEARKVLETAGLVRDGYIDYTLALEVVKLILRDEYLKNLVLRYVVDTYREDLRKLLGITFAGIKLEWSEDFENFLSERKKRRKVRDLETISYYRNLFKKYLEGRELSEELVEYIANHRNGWLRNVFRHYIQYLYHRRRIPPETFGWIMEVVPSRSYRLDVRPYQISLEDVRKTMRFLKENHEVYYTVYRAMLESGARFKHVLEMIRTWNPKEIVLIESIDLETERLVCFDKFCRYYLGLRSHQKPCEWIYISRETAELLKAIAPRKIGRRDVWEYVKRRSMVLPKMIRKIAWRIMVKTMPREVVRFIQSRFGELKISEARYEDLLSKTDKHYPRYLNTITSSIYL
ncbi:MAG: integrase [Thermosphaera sp.]